MVRYVTGDDSKLVFRDGFLAWADKEKFGDLWRFQREFGGGAPPPDVNIAFQIFINPSARYTLGLLIFSTADDEGIRESIKEKLSIDLSLKSLSTYRRLFWDLDLMGRENWPTFIKTLSGPERHYLAAGVNGISDTKARSTLGLSNTHAPDEILARIANKAYEQFEAAVDKPNPELANARCWADLAVKASSALKGARSRFHAEESRPETTEAIQGMFSVEITESNHITLSELQGQFERPVRDGG